jgi:glycosyltransferase involved in cell wall biosynthesis
VRYSIITPTLVRPTLRRLCDSISAQTVQDWEHIVMVDTPLVTQPAKRAIIDALPKDPRRRVFRCGTSHKDYGNTCRWNAWEKVRGDYVLYIDDDDWYADDKVLETLNQVTAEWAIFPCTRRGEYYLADPPGIMRTGSNMFMHKRAAGRYPCAGHCEEHQSIIAHLNKIHPHDSLHSHLYAADGMLVEYLKSKHPYQVVTGRPLTIYEQDNRGKE